MPSIIPFSKLRRQARRRVVKAPPDVKRRVVNILKMLARGRISEPTACYLLEDTLPALPESYKLDCGSFYVSMFYAVFDDEYAPAPVVDIRGKQYSHSGSCPRCGARVPCRLLGSGYDVEVMCGSCYTVYTTNDRVID